MKKSIILTGLFFLTGLCLVCAQDLVILKDGNVIEAKVTEISPTEIKYKRFSHLDGPIIIIPRTDVLSIRYENKTVEIINSISITRPELNQSDMPDFLQSGEPTLLQQTLNRLPAIPIAGNNLKFEFRGETWIAKVNGENFSAGTIVFEVTMEGGILTLRQTHIWPGTIARTAGRIANIIPGGSTVGGVLNTAGNIANAVGAIEMPGSIIVLEYKAGPPASLRLLSSSRNGNQTEKPANVRNNWLSVGATIAGAGLKYELMLNSYWSLGIDAHYQTFGIGTEIEFGINASVRAYPFGKILYLGVGLGVYGYGNSYYTSSYYSSYYNWDYTIGFAVSPELGIKLDLGRPGGFFMDIGVKGPQIFGGRRGYWFSVVPYIGFGGAF